MAASFLDGSLGDGVAVGAVACDVGVDIRPVDE